jgi:hypothetical protein
MEREEKLAKFGSGPWMDEPDRVEFEAFGLPCLITRHPECGHLCGYVAVLPGHPLHGVDHHAEPVAELLAHRSGVNYSKPCADGVCHVPQPGEPDDVWWFGFHCAEYGDAMPISFDFMKAMGGTYKTIDYVRTECGMLAAQLAAHANVRCTAEADHG